MLHRVHSATPYFSSRFLLYTQLVHCSASLLILRSAASCTQCHSLLFLSLLAVHAAGAKPGNAAVPAKPSTSKLNPFAKSFSLNVGAKEFVPSFGGGTAAGAAATAGGSGGGDVGVWIVGVWAWVGVLLLEQYVLQMGVWVEVGMSGHGQVVLRGVRAECGREWGWACG